ncbi:MAG: hypothetical protein ACJ71Q_17290 [Terriglobales bacterium]
MDQIRVGQTFTYDDGRPNHHNVQAVVIAITPNGFIAQFEDRCETTNICWDEAEWMRYIKFQP